MTAIYYSLQAYKDILKKRKPSSVVLVTSSVLEKKLSSAVHFFISATKKIGIKISIIHIPDGESAKEWKILEKLLFDFIQAGLDRNGLVLAIGGGSAGDVVGFAASIYQRGVDYVQIPTTLLAQVDSAHGGKTGINFLGFKNQIGIINSPIAIIVEEKFIATLNNDQLIDGLGEIIKAGFIKDVSILQLLRKTTLLELKSGKNLSAIISKSIKVKNGLVDKDKFDKGVRLLLNVGHTAGHAIELKYSLPHGKAVILGMLKEFEVTCKLGLSETGIYDQLKEILSSIGMTFNEKKFIADTQKMLRDKKISGANLLLPIVIKAGKAKLVRISAEKFFSALKSIA